MKNTNAIDKIIAELCMKEYKKSNPNPKMYKNGMTNYHPYSLTDEINEFRQIKADYQADVISEEEYKTACLRYNLRERGNHEKVS